MHDHAILFIQDLAIIMIVAGITTVLCRHFRQPIVLGYLLAGVIIGPYTPPFSYISDPHIIKTLAELGVIFLMFSLGLEFNISKLAKVGKTALVAATLEIIFMIWLGNEAGLLFGWSQINAIFLGAILAISSTTIIIKALDELKLKNESFSQIVFGILIVEDIYAIIILALLSTVAVSDQFQFTHALITTVKLLGFLAVALIGGMLIVPRLLAFIASYHNDEMLLISVLGICFGFCLLVIKMQYSVALGAFIIGAIMAEAKCLQKIEHLISSLRDMFSAIFFVTIGLLFNPDVLIHYFVPTLTIIVLVVLGKIISTSFGALIAGNDGKTSMRVGMSLAQIGEFSFIIASLGIALDVTDGFLYSIAISVSIVTTVLTPYLIKYSDRAANLISRCVPGPVAKTFDVYTDWVHNIQPTQEQISLQNAIDQSVKQVMINFLIVVAIFSFGIFLANSTFGDILIQFINDDVEHSIVWAGSLIVAMPFIIASYRKVRAISMILAELNVKAAAKSKFTQQIRGSIAQFIPILYSSMLSILILLLSANILPPIELLILILFIAAIMVFFLLPWFIKIHSKLQVFISEKMKSD